MIAKKAIVTGGAGFIGSHLAQRLIGEGIETIVLDDFSNGRIENLEAFKDDRRLQVHRVDCADFQKIKGFFKGVDWVFHLAALADIVPSIVEPLKYHRANVDGTVAVLEASRQGAVKKIIYAASSSCYGIPEAYPTPEDADISPQYPYALTKYVAEQYVFFWSRLYKIPALSLRLFNVYGTRSRTSGTYGAVLGIFLSQKLAGAPFTIVGDGNQTRDFVFVSDVVDAFVKAARSESSGEAFNVGSGKPQSVNTLASLLGGQKVYIPKRPGEPDRTWADITKIRRLLGWSPKVSFEEGIKIVMDNIDYWRGAPVWTPGKIAEATEDWFKYLSR